MVLEAEGLPCITGPGNHNRLVDPILLQLPFEGKRLRVSLGCQGH